MARQNRAPRSTWTTCRRGGPGGQQQPVRTSKVAGCEADEDRALYVIADLLDGYLGIHAVVIASRLGEILRCTAIELKPTGTCPLGFAGPSAISLMLCR